MLESGVALLEIQRILGHASILSTTRYTHLSSRTQHNADQAINTLMNRFTVSWGSVK
ncbi:MAG: hypothetical protein KDF62_07170 [Nitrosomonas sp.]|nr:hypothetical protein [Nitrosomonas sp.]MCB1948748.1 hypothetical protein [Nitrosomonas sp.]